MIHTSRIGTTSHSQTNKKEGRKDCSNDPTLFSHIYIHNNEVHNWRVALQAKEQPHALSIEGIVVRWTLRYFFLTSSNRKRRNVVGIPCTKYFDVVERIDTTYATPDRLGSLLYCNPCTWWEGQGGDGVATFWCRNSAVSLLFSVPDVSHGYTHPSYTTK